MTNQDKFFGSDHYRRKIKRFTERIKAFRGMARIPNPPHRPHKDKKKQDMFDKAYPTALDKSVLKYWLTSPEFDDTRRTVRSDDFMDKVDGGPKDSIKY